MAENVTLFNQDFVPQKGQDRLYAAARDGTHTYLVYFGGWGAGKTRLGCEIVWLLALMYPNGRLAVVRNTYKNLKGSTMATFFDQVMCMPASRATSHPYVRSWNKNELKLELINDTRIDFISLDTQKRSSFGSWPFNGIYIDEAQEASEEQFRDIDGRLRWEGENKSIPMQHLILTGTPNGRNWIYRQFFRPGSESKDALAVIGKTVDNIDHLPKRYVENKLERMLPTHRKRFLEADFSAFEGQVFDAFDRRVHVWAQREVDEKLKEVRKRGGYRLYRTIDLGAKAPWSCLWATFDHMDDTLYFEHEYYQAGLSLPEHCKNIIDRSAIRDPEGKLVEEDRLTICDTQMFSTDAVTGKTLYAHMDENGIHAFGADKSIHTGILRLQDVIARKKIVIADSCEHLIDAIECCQWDPRTAEQGREKPLKNDRDHPLDAARYLAAEVWPSIRPGTFGASDPDEEEDASWVDLRPNSGTGAQMQMPQYPGMNVDKRYGSLAKHYGRPRKAPGLAHGRIVHA